MVCDVPRLIGSGQWSKRKHLAENYMQCFRGSTREGVEKYVLCTRRGRDETAPRIAPRITQILEIIKPMLIIITCQKNEKSEFRI